MQRGVDGQRVDPKGKRSQPTAALPLPRTQDLPGMFYSGVNLE